MHPLNPLHLPVVKWLKNVKNQSAGRLSYVDPTSSTHLDKQFRANLSSSQLPFLHLPNPVVKKKNMGKSKFTYIIHWRHQ